MPCLRVLPVLCCGYSNGSSDATRLGMPAPCTTAAAGVPVFSDASKDGTPCRTPARQAGPIARHVACAVQQKSGATCHMPCYTRRRILANRAGDLTERQSIIRPKSRHRVLAVSTTALGPTEGYSAVLTGSRATGQTCACALAVSTARCATKSDLYPNDDLGHGCAVYLRMRVRTSRDRLADPKRPGASALARLIADHAQLE